MGLYLELWRLNDCGQVCGDVDFGNIPTQSVSSDTIISETLTLN